MKRLLSILIMLTLCLTACRDGSISSSAGDSQNSNVKKSPASSWAVTEDITISLSQDTFAPGTEEFTVTFTNTGDQVMLYGESYSFQYYDGSDWKNLETIENYGFNMVGYLLFPGATQTLSVAPWMLTEPLPEGRCRIIGCTLRVANSDNQLSYGGDYTEYPPYELEFDIT